MECWLSSPVWSTPSNARSRFRQKMGQLKPTYHPKKQIHLRAGINLGDVIIDSDDIFGDGVIVATRLESIAAAGEIIVSDAAMQVTQSKDFSFADLGLHQLKNIARPIRLYRVTSNVAGNARKSGLEPSRSAEMPSRRSALAILPLVNLGTGPEQEYFADGMTEELTIALTRVGWFSVIGGASTRAYKGQATTSLQVGRELQVRYVLSGSVRQAHARVRISCQLVEAETGHHVWAERFEGSLADVFALQDRVADAVASAVEPGLERAEIDRVRTRPTKDLTAYDLYLRSLPPFYTSTEVGCAEAVALLRRATALDPGFDLAKAQLVGCLTVRVEQGWANPGEREEGIRLAREVSLNCGKDPLALVGAVYAFGILAHDRAAALDVARRALRLNPNSALVQGAAGLAYAWECDPVTSGAQFTRAINLNSYDPDLAYWVTGLARVELMARRPENAVRLAEQAIRHKASCVPAYKVLVCALSNLGRVGEAASLVGRLRAAVPKAAHFSAALTRQMYRDQAFAELLIGGWRKAEMPEQEDDGVALASRPEP